MKKAFAYVKQSLKTFLLTVEDTFKVGDLEFIVLEHDGELTSVILKDFWKSAQFDCDCNDYKESDIRKDLNENFYKELSVLVGSENIVKHKVDLTADDGLKDYESCEDNISLLTCEMYRKYIYILRKYNPEKWWWLSTAYSTKSNDYTYSVRVVYISGALCNDNCFNNSSVRPFCIFSPLIFES